MVGIVVELSAQSKMLLMSLAISGFLLAIGIVTNLGVLANAIILSTFIIAAPQLLLKYKRYREFKEMEEKFPAFLRDVIESLRSGMPFHRAVISSSRFEYGKLSKQIKKMANQLTWGMPLDRVLDQFAERVKKSKRLFTSTKIIRESHLSGGDVISTLESVAGNSMLLEESEKERKSLLNQYVVLMYAISLVFIAVVVAINNLMLPIFETSATIGATEILGLTNPCDACVGFGCSVCGLYGWTANYLFSIDPTKLAAYYTSLFFFMSLIQSVFSGLVAGQISENSIIAGIKHSLILTAIAFSAFYLLVYMGILGA